MSPRSIGGLIALLSAALGLWLFFVAIPPSDGPASPLTAPPAAAESDASSAPITADANSSAPAVIATPPELIGARRLIEASTQTLRDVPPLRDRWSGATTQAESWFPDAGDISFRHRVRLVRTRMKHALVRIEETYRLSPDGSTETLVRQAAMVADHVMVSVADDADPALFHAALSRHGLSLRPSPATQAFQLVAIATQANTDSLPSAIDTLNSLSGVVAVAEPDYIVHRSILPDDPDFPNLYALHNTGQSGGDADADIDAPEAWEATTGSLSIIVGVIDSGIDYNHSDLGRNIWRNPGEIPANGIDDDGNGYVDDVLGWNFVDSNADPRGGSHGTMVASIIGAIGDNRSGVTGVNWDVSLIPIRFLDSEGYGLTSDAIASIRYAIGAGAHLTCNSWGGSENSLILRAAIAEAADAGQLFVAAAGNDGRNNDNNPEYPASFDLDNIVSVAATDRRDARWSYTNYGKTSVDLAAPGVDITTISTHYSGYETQSGTSLAAPYVAGTAALVLAQTGPLSVAQLKASLLDSVDPLDSLNNRVVTGGRLNAANAVTGRNRVLHHFAIDALPASTVRGVPLTVRIRALDAKGLPVGNFDSPVAITALGTDLASPVVASGWRYGVWTGTVTPSAFTTEARLQVASSGSAPAVSSTPFAVILGPLARVRWDPIPSPVEADHPITVSLQTTDIGGNPVDHDGPVALAALLPFTLPPTHQMNGSGSGVFMSFPVARHQVLYPAEELGSKPRFLTGLALYFSSPHETAVFNQWTIRLKHGAPGQTGLTGDEQDWVTVHSSPTLTPSTFGWRDFTFDAPFDYDGTRPLLVEFSYRNATGATGVSGHISINAQYYLSTERSRIAWATSDRDPLTLTRFATKEHVPNLRFSSLEPVPVTPSTALLVNGAWSGAVATALVEPAIRFRASIDAPLASGYGDSFAVSPRPTPPSPPAPLTETWESGELASHWTIPDSNSGIAVVSRYHAPHSGIGHLILQARDNATNARTEATLTMNLEHHSGVSLAFWAKGFGSNGPPPPSTPFTGHSNFDGVAISADGVTWHAITALRAPALTTEWSRFEIDLDAALASRSLSYTPNFKIRFSRYGAANPPIGGIALDDISVTATETPVGPVIGLPASASESSPPLAATLTLPSALSADTVFVVSNPAPTKLALPATITLPAGQSSVGFLATPIDDHLFDGARTIHIVATPPAGSGLVAGMAALLLTDDDQPTPSLALSSDRLSENSNGVSIGTVTLPSPPSGPVTLSLAADEPSAFTLPKHLSFAPGQLAATFEIRPVNNAYRDGDRALTITAGLPGGMRAEAPLIAVDDEGADFSFYIVHLAEGQTRQSTINVRGLLRQPLAVSLVSGNPSRLSAPSTITIPADAKSVLFDLAASENTDIGDSTVVRLTASAPGFTTSGADVTVTDNDLSYIEVALPAADPLGNQPFNVILRARDSNGNILNTVNQTVRLVARAGDDRVLPLNIETASIVNGYAYLNAVRVGDTGDDVRIIVTTPDDRSFESRSFDLGVGPLARFAVHVDGPAAQVTNRPLSVSIVATDVFGNPVPGFNEPVSLEIGTAWREIGADPVAVSWFPLVGDLNAAHRTQAVYPAQDIGPAGAIDGIALHVANPRGGDLPNWTIRIKQHPSLQNFAFFSADWTTVYQGALPASATGWVHFPFSAAFMHDGVSPVMIDFSFYDPTTANVSSGSIYATERGIGNWTYTRSQLKTGTPTDPLTWSGFTGTSSTFSPNLLVVRQGGETLYQGASGTLVDGAWSGTITPSLPGSGPVVLRARHGGVIGQSAPFTLSQPPPDTDTDGLPDAWETTHGLNASATDADHGRLGDPDHDGIPNLLEYAMGLDPRSAEAQAPVSSMVEAHPESGQSHLLYTYRRLIYPGALTYTVTTSTNLANWSAPAVAPETLSTVANPDGVTETVTLRINPALDAGRVFIRLEVDAP